MTREEYDEKTANGTITVQDVILNRQYATPEQLAILGEGSRLEREITVLRRDVEHLNEIYRLFSEASALFGRLPLEMGNAVALDRWAALSTKITNRPNTKRALFDCCDVCENIGHKIVTVLAEVEGIPEGTRQTLTEFAGVLSDLNGELFDTAEELGTEPTDAPPISDNITLRK